MLIVEDVVLVAERIDYLVRQHWQGTIERLDIAHSFEHAELVLKERVYDIVFLDLNLHGRQGFDLLNAGAGFRTVVITANETEAARAYDLGVFDFIRKPITAARFALAMNRLETAIEQGLGRPAYLAVKSRRGIDMVPIADICHIKAAKNYAEIFLKSQTVLLHDHSINSLHQQLAPGFLRVHRSYLTHRDHIRRLINHGGGKYTAELHNGVCIPINRATYQDLKSPQPGQASPENPKK